MATFSHLFNDDLFTTYDVRGTIGEELTKDDAFHFGVAFGIFLNKRRTLVKKIFGFLISEKPKVVVGSDVLDENIELTEKFIQGLIACGINVVDVGILTSPAVYYCVSHFDCEAGVSITSATFQNDASSEYLGQIKFLLNEEPLDGEEIKEFCAKLENGVSVYAPEKGVINEIDILETYITEILSVLKFNSEKKLRVGIDCLDGSSGMILSKMLKKLPFEIILKNEQCEGKFELISPDPLSMKNISNLETFIKEENLDIAFNINGNGNRLSAMTKNGKVLKGDELAFILIQDYLKDVKNMKRNIVLDLAYSIELERQIKAMGGNVFIASTGQSEIREKMRKVNANIGMESKGHLYLKNGFYGYDDAIFTLFKIISILSFENSEVDEIISKMVFTFKTSEIRIKTMHEDEKFLKIKEFLISELKPERIIEAEGVKLIFDNENASIMVRVCNTEDAISFKAEALNVDTFIKLEKILETIKLKFF